VKSSNDCLPKGGGKKELGLEAGPEGIKALLANIYVLISHVLQGMNGAVGWKLIALMVAGGADIVQSTSGNTAAKYGMSSFGIEIYINKIAVNNQREKQTMLQVVQVQKMPIFWKAIG
jgi:hypothetical protein